MKRIVSFICLIVCTLIWGTTFVAQDSGMDHIGPFTFHSTRFFVAFLAVLPFVLIFEKNKIIKHLKSEKKMFIKLMIPVGLSLFLGTQLQQVSLIYTDVANSAFFTIFYVPLVPIIIYFLFSDTPHRSVWPSVVVCVLGGYFLSDFKDAEVRLGDGIVLLGAIFWALHIIYIGKLVTKFNLPFFIALLQNLAVAVLSFLLVIIF